MRFDESGGLKGMLNSYDKWLGKSQSSLTSMFRKALLKLNVTEATWNKLMHNYVNDPTNRIPKCPKYRSSVRGNLSKALLKPSITWDSFIKGIKLLNPVKAKMTLEIEFPGRRIVKTKLDLLTGKELDENDEEINFLDRSKKL